MKSYKVVVTQPRYIPWIPYIRRMHLADDIIILDDVQRTVRGFENRSLFWDPQKRKRWLSIPVESGSRELICDSTIVMDRDWRENHLNKIRGWYGVDVHEWIPEPRPGYQGYLESSVQRIFACLGFEKKLFYYSSDIKNHLPKFFSKDPQGVDLIEALLLGHRMLHYDDFDKLLYYTGTDVLTYMGNEEVRQWEEWYNMGLYVDDWRPGWCGKEEAGLSLLHHWLIHPENVKDIFKLDT